MNNSLEKHKAEILQLAARNHIKRVRVFGSFARGEETPRSDLDLLVELEQGATGFALGGFLMDVSELMERRVDVVTENALHPAIRKKVLSEAIPL